MDISGFFKYNVKKDLTRCKIRVSALRERHGW